MTRSKKIGDGKDEVSLVLEPGAVERKVSVSLEEVEEAWKILYIDFESLLQ